METLKSLLKPARFVLNSVGAACIFTFLGMVIVAGLWFLWNLAIILGMAR